MQDPEFTLAPGTNNWMQDLAWDPLAPDGNWSRRSGAKGWFLIILRLYSPFQLRPASALGATIQSRAGHLCTGMPT
jgi:hypothetical protein